MTAPSSTTAPNQPQTSNPPADSGDKSTPGIYLVNSGIRPSAKSIFSPDLLNKWYNEVHIPDIFATSPRIIDTAYRFSAITGSTPRAPATSSNDGSDDASGSGSDNNSGGELPYLAVYPLTSTSLLTTESSPLWTVPLTSEILPNESKHIFELVDFQMGIWEKIIQLGDSRSPADTSSCSSPTATGKFLALVGISISRDESQQAQGGSKSECDLEGILEWSVVVEDETVEGGKKLPEPKAKTSTLLRWIEYHPPGAPLPKNEGENQNKKEGVDLSGYKRYLAIHEYDELPTGKLVGNNGAQVYLFSALNSFGDVSKAW